MERFTLAQAAAWTKGEARGEARAEKRNNEKVVMNMYKKGYTLDQIADVEETSVAAVEAVIKKKEPAMA